MPAEEAPAPEAKTDAAAATTEITLAAGHELRLEIDSKKELAVRLVRGTAELFGTELSPALTYKLRGPRKTAVFSWHGCVLRLTGDRALVQYVAEETPMRVYLKCHLALSAQRRRAAEAASAAEARRQAPRVLVVGPADVGKNAIVNLLGNWAMRSGHAPLMVDLDTTQASFSLPGTVAACALAQPLDIEDEYARSVYDVLAFYYGFSQPTDKPKLYRAAVANAARACAAKQDLDPALAAAGLVVNTPSVFCSSGAGADLLAHAVDTLEITCVLVLAHERLCADLRQRYPPGRGGPTILQLPKSGGVVAKDAAFRREVQDQRIHEYFYGTPREPWHPQRETVRFDDAHVRRVGEAAAPPSALPLGAAPTVTDSRFLVVTPGDIFLHSVLAVVHQDVPSAETAAPESDAESDLLRVAPVAGFVYVSAVDSAKRKLTVLAPAASGKSASPRFWLFGSLKWIER